MTAHEPDGATGRRRVVVTGCGVVSPLGCAPRRLWQRLLAGDSAVAPIRRFDATGFPTRIAAEVPDDEVALPPDVAPPRPWEELDRIARFALVAAAQAVRAAALDGVPRQRIGVVMASGLGTYGHHELFAACAAATAAGSFAPETFARRLAATLLPRSAERRTPGSLPALIARQHGFAGPLLAVMTACAGGTQAIGDAARWVRTGAADVVLAGGADSEIYPMGLASFCLLGALSRRNDDPAGASRPFDAGRDGFVLGEGAGAVVLEEMDHARRRGATILAEVAGFGSACDAYRVTDPHPDGRGAELAMRRALADAGVGPEAVGYVNAHGTSTVANDRIETLALRRLLGERSGAVPVSSTKSMIGHLTVAAGAVEAIVTALTLAHGAIHPTINQSQPDPECGLDTVPNRSRPAPPDLALALSNSFAFGGQCASLLLRRAAPAVPAAAAAAVPSP
jgi:3-oxoacyl-[acyl-carrier-protein] synthase II